MYSEKHPSLHSNLPVVPYPFRVVVSLMATVLFAATLCLAQSGGDQQNPPQKQSQQDQMPDASGGPTGDSGPIIVPKKNTSEEPPPPPRPKQTENPEYSLHVDVPVVTVDAHVLQKDGRPLALSEEVAKEHFKIWEDGVPQQIQSVTMSKAPITAVLLVEFAATNYNFMYDALNASYVFASNLQPQDWVAVVEFDMKTHVLVDFTQDKQAIFGALNMLRVPGFSETNIFDAMSRPHARPSGSHSGTQRIGHRRQRTRYVQQTHSRQNPEEGESHPQRDHLYHLHGRGFPGAS